MTDLAEGAGPNRALLLHLLVEQAREQGFIFIDPRGRVIEWSTGAEKLFGYSRQEALGQEFARFFSARDREHGIDDLEIAIARADAISEDDRWHVRKDGSRFWSTGSLTALRDDNGAIVGFAKVLRDRTNLKEQLELLTRQLDGAREDGRKQAIAVAKLSHELRNLVAALSHGVQMTSSPRTDAARRDALVGAMQEQIEMIRRLTEDLLDIERMKEGKVSLQLSPLVLQEVVHKAVESQRPRLAVKRLQLDVFAPEVPLRMHADATRLHQVFVNLIDNAIKYTTADGRIWVKTTIEDADAVVHIEDTGVGIPPEMLPKIFELFTQVDVDATHHGLGIGLALVRDLVSMHGGSVQARSEGRGQGSTFTVRLPLRATN